MTGAPTIHEVAAVVYEEGQYLRRAFRPEDLRDNPEDVPGTPCRLQVHDGTWALHTGSPDYDQDHRGSWGCGFVPQRCSREDAQEIARDLLEQVAIARGER